MRLPGISRPQVTSTRLAIVETGGVWFPLGHEHGEREEKRIEQGI